MEVYMTVPPRPAFAEPPVSTHTTFGLSDLRPRFLWCSLTRNLNRALTDEGQQTKHSMVLEFPWHRRDFWREREAAVDHKCVA